MLNMHGGYLVIALHCSLCQKGMSVAQDFWYEGLTGRFFIGIAFWSHHLLALFMWLHTLLNMSCKAQMCELGRDTHAFLWLLGTKLVLCISGKFYFLRYSQSSNKSTYLHGCFFICSFLHWCWQEECVPQYCSYLSLCILNKAVLSPGFHYNIVE